MAGSWSRSVDDKALVISLSKTEHRGNLALALCLASMSFRGDRFDMAQLMALADEYLSYIEGDDATPVPRPDLSGGVKAK